MKKITALAALAAILVSAGCSTHTTLTGGTQPDRQQTELGSLPSSPDIEENDIAFETAEVPAEEPDTPPELLIESGGHGLVSAARMTKGGFSWTRSDGSTVMTDAFSAVQAAEQGAITAVLDLSSIEGDPRVLLPENGEIVSVTCFAGYSEQKVGFGADGTVFLPESPIGRAYSVDVKFDKGNCSYYFMTTDPLEALASPPQLYLRLDGDEIKMTKGGFSWEYTIGDATAKAMTDVASPMQMLEMGVLPVLDLESMTSVTVLLPENAEMTRAEYFTSDEEPPVSMEYSGDTVYLPDSPNGKVYEISVTFPNGNCTYLFAGAESICTLPYDPAAANEQNDGDINDIGEIYYKDVTGDDTSTDPETGIQYAKNQLLISAFPETEKAQIEKIVEELNADIVGFIELTGDYQIEFREDKTLKELDELAEYIGSYPFIISVTLNLVSPLSATE